VPSASRRGHGQTDRPRLVVVLEHILIALKVIDDRQLDAVRLELDRELFEPEDSSLRAPRNLELLRGFLQRDTTSRRSNRPCRSPQRLSPSQLPVAYFTTLYIFHAVKRDSLSCEAGRETLRYPSILMTDTY
jgi:hypothetical protein